VTYAHGTATITGGTDTKTVTHGLGYAPAITDIILSPLDDLAGRTLYPDNVTAVTFDAVLSFTDVPGADHSFNWIIPFPLGSDVPSAAGDVYLDGKALAVISISEGFVAIGAEYDKWDTTKKQAVRKFNVKGISRRWTVRFIENAVGWSGGCAASFQQTASAGTAVAFTCDSEVRIINTTVQIAGMDLGPIQDLGGKNIRYCTVQLLEAS
jgi:hypothetical protein